MSEVRLSEMMAMEAEDSNVDVSLKTGVNVGEVPKFSRKETNMRPNAVRWVFNPFAIVDLANESAPFSVPCLQPVIFNKIQSIPTRTQLHKPFETDLIPGPGGDDAEYTRIDRTSYQQAGDLTDKHGEKGVTILSKMFDMTDEEAEDLNTLLFGDSIRCKVDANDERFPVPVLPNLLESLQKNARQAISDANKVNAAEDAALISATADELRKAIAEGMRFARATISDAQARLLDEKNPNRKFSAAEERCYLALGEEIPNQMPLLTKSQSAGQGAGIDSEALGRGIAAGMAAAAAPVAPVAPSTRAVETVELPKAELSGVICTATKGNGDPCKNKAVDGVLCRAHGGGSE